MSELSSKESFMAGSFGFSCGCGGERLGKIQRDRRRNPVPADDPLHGADLDVRVLARLALGGIRIAGLDRFDDVRMSLNRILRILFAEIERNPAKIQVPGQHLVLEQERDREEAAVGQIVEDRVPASADDGEVEFAVDVEGVDQFLLPESLGLPVPELLKLQNQRQRARERKPAAGDRGSIPSRISYHSSMFCSVKHFVR